MFSKYSNTKAQGNIGMALAIAYYVKQGYTISIPMNDSQEYDLVVDIEGFLHKVQVKTTKCKSPYGIYAVGLKNCGGTSGTINSRVCDSDIDLLFVVTEAGDLYNIPFMEIQDKKSSINLGDKYQEFRVT